MSFNFGNQFWLHDEELMALADTVPKQTGSDLSQTKKSTRRIMEITLGKDNTGVEVKEDLECQLAIGGQIETIVVDVLAFTSGKPTMIAVMIPGLDAMTRDELSEIVIWRCVAAYAHYGRTKKVKLSALICDKMKNLSCSVSIDRGAVKQVAQQGRIDVSLIEYDWRY